jgi:hypothetical protein
VQVAPLLAALSAVANAERCVQRVMTALAKKGLLGKVGSPSTSQPSRVGSNFTRWDLLVSCGFRLVKVRHWVSSRAPPRLRARRTPRRMMEWWSLLDGAGI